MNILFLTYEGDTAGSTYSISYLTKGLAERGHYIYMGCRRESLLYQLLEGSKVVRVPMTFRGKFDLDNMRQIRDVVKQNNIQLINAQSSLDRYTSIFANWFYSLHVPVIHTRRQTPASVGGFVQNRFYTMGTQKIVAVSNGVKEKLVQLGLPARHIEVIYNGTPAEKYVLKNPARVAELRRKYQLSDGDIVIGCVSRRKQQEQLLAALKLIDFPVKVMLVGVEEEARYRAIIESYTTPHQVIFTGTVSGSEALYYYRLFTMNVLPSITEGLSQALLEAMAMDVPVIATRAAGNIDLIEEGKNGFLFGENKLEELAAAIKKVLEPGVRKTLIDNGRETVFERFSIENTIGNYEKFFDKMIYGG